jgi:hypothetical protein
MRKPFFWAFQNGFQKEGIITGFENWVLKKASNLLDAPICN